MCLSLLFAIIRESEKQLCAFTQNSMCSHFSLHFAWAGATVWHLLMSFKLNFKPRPILNTVDIVNRSVKWCNFLKTFVYFSVLKGCSGFLLPLKLFREYVQFPSCWDELDEKIDTILTFTYEPTTSSKLDEFSLRTGNRIQIICLCSVETERGTACYFEVARWPAKFQEVTKKIVQFMTQRNHNFLFYI